MKMLLTAVVWLQVQLFRLETWLASRLVKARKIGGGEYFIGYSLECQSIKVLKATNFKPMEYFEGLFPKTGELATLNCVWIVAGPVETFWNPHLDHLMRMDAAEGDDQRSEMFRELLGTALIHDHSRLEALWREAKEYTGED